MKKHAKNNIFLENKANFGKKRKQEQNENKEKDEQEERCSAITFSQQKQILKRIQDERYKNFFVFCCCTGVRVCEALSIKVKDIDKKNKVIKITLQDSKTKKHKRQVPFLPELLDGYNLKGKLLFEDITDDGSKQFFYKLYKELGFDLSRHSTRHTFVSICQHLKVNPEKIQNWVGHTDLKMTNNTYTHKLNKGTSPILEYLKKLAKEHEDEKIEY